MNTENETGVKAPKGQINYNPVAGSLGLAAFAGLGLRNWLGNGKGLVAAGVTAVAETQLVSSLMTELAKEKSERYADNVGINTFKEALALIKEERETRQANDKIIFETLARLDKESALNKQDIENFKKEVAREFSDVRHDFKAAIALEAERRESADERIFDYANCNFVKYIKKINAAEICPVVELAARTAGPAVPDSNAHITSTANA